MFSAVTCRKKKTETRMVPSMLFFQQNNINMDRLAWKRPRKYLELSLVCEVICLAALESVSGSDLIACPASLYRSLIHTELVMAL